MARFLIKSFGLEAVFFDSASGDTHYLPPLAQAIYSARLEHPGLDAGELVALAASRLGVPPEPALRSEVEGILRQLQRVGIIETP